MKTNFIRLLVFACICLSGVCSAVCTAHTPAGHNAGYLIANKSLLKRTWSMPACPWLEEDDHVCCSEQQYRSLAFNMLVLNATFHGCPACNYALESLLCHFTCAKNQSEYVGILKSREVPKSILSGSDEDATDQVEQVLEEQLTVSESFSHRLWMACFNATLGDEKVDHTFSNVTVFFETIIEHSPMTSASSRLLGKIVVASSSTDNTPLNVSTINDQYNCSQNQSYVPPPPTTPSPHGKKGSSGSSGDDDTHGLKPAAKGVVAFIVIFFAAAFVAMALHRRKQRMMGDGIVDESSPINTANSV